MSAENRTDGKPIGLDEPALMAMACGAVAYSPPPMRAVRGVSMTFEQLHDFVAAILEAARAQQQAASEDGNG